MNSLKFLLSNYLKLKRSSRSASASSGFTLIELLVAMIIAALVIGSLLGFMLNILTTDRREQAKSTSEQELQAAIDYIGRDLAQAVYVYDADGISRNKDTSANAATLSGIRNQIPPVKPAPGCDSTANCEPILVFWKRTSLPRDLGVTSSSGTNTTVGCLATLPGGGCNNQDYFAYSLVAYYLIKDNATGTNWSNTARRIGRFEIRDGIRTADTSKPTRSETVNGQTISVNYLLFPSAGFMAPNLSLSGDLKARMNQWTTHSTDYNTNVDTLVDFVDQNTIASSLPFTCASPQRVPAATATGIPDSFYACVDSSRTLAQVYLRGNALARFSKTSNYSPTQSAYFPTTQIQVQGRGFLNAR